MLTVHTTHTVLYEMMEIALYQWWKNMLTSLAYCDIVD